jgi:gliding motility-associated-like protein
MNYFFRCFIFIAFFMMGLLASVEGQISSNSADWKGATAYSSFDTIFVFYQYPVSQKGSLTVNNPFSTSAIFSWCRYDTLSNAFSPAFKTENGVSNSSIDTLSEGGYRISITGTTRDTSFMAWVFFDNFLLVVDKDNAGKVKFGKYTCDYVDLGSKVTSLTSFIYRDPTTHQRDTLTNSVTYVWSADPTPETALTNGKASFRIDDPPYKDTRYTLDVTDRFGLVKEDQVLYESIQVKAQFKMDHDSVSDNTGTYKNSAPLKVTFTNQSENMDTCVWYMGDKDTVYAKTPDVHTYYEPKTYTVHLIASSLEQCIDSCKQEIVVDPPEINVPNVFTPNGDGTNDMFKIYNISIRKFRITIFSRWGKKVYVAEGEDFESWPGWNGKIGNSEASEGVYYYYLETKSFGLNTESPESYNSNGIYKGFFYLYRGN